MNLQLYGALPTALIGLMLSERFARNWSWTRRACLLLVASVGAAPSCLFLAYYLHVWGGLERSAWFYELRAQPYSEWFIVAAAPFWGSLSTLRHGTRFGKRVRFCSFALFLLVVMTPHLKAVFLRADVDKFHERSSDGVCLQSTESSCGPCSAVTLLGSMGIQASEKEIAEESFTSRTGTEVWHLMRSLRKRGVPVWIEFADPLQGEFPAQAIAGVQVSSHGTVFGHFIPILERKEDRFQIGDPLVGREWLKKTDLLQRYQFTGFFLRIGRR